MSEDESFDSFYRKLNEVVISKFNLGEKTEDSKVVRKILRSLPESFRAKLTTIEESKDLDEIKVQELIGSLQTYELSLPNQRKSSPGGVAQLGEIPHASIRSLVRVVAGTVWEEGFLACIVPLLLALLGC